MVHEPDLGGGLCLKQPHEVGVRHRIEGMPRQRGLRQRQGADEQVSLVDGPAVGRRGRADERHLAVQRVRESEPDRPDVAAPGGIEGRADLEADPVRTEFT